MGVPQTHEFIAEAKDHLAVICDQLLHLERSAAESASDRFTAMLRAAHSVKGGAGFFGLRAIEQLMHHMETVLESVVEGVVPSDSHLVDVLLAATDRVAALLDDLEGSLQADVQDVLARLDELLVPVSEREVASPVADAVHRLGTSEVGSEDAPASGEGATEAFPLAIDLTDYQRRGWTVEEVVERALKLGVVEQGRIESAAHDHLLPVGPVMWRGLVISPLSSDDFYAQMQLPPDQSLQAERLDSTPSPEIQELEVSAVPTPIPAPPTAIMSDRTQSIRIPVELADRLMNLSGELVLVRNQSRRFADANQPLPPSVVQRFEAVTSDFQETVLQTRMQPVGNLFSKFPRLVRDLSRQLNKQIELHLAGAEVELDKAILDAISDPLVHLVRNACDHGIETPELRLSQGKSATGHIHLMARHEGDQICICVEDDGRGIDREVVARQLIKQGLRTQEQLTRLSDRDLIALILLPGFSTASQVTDVSGRGVGTDVVRTNLLQLGGTVEIDSQLGQGTTFTLRLPLTLAIIPALLISSSRYAYAIPQKDVEELVRIDAQQTRAQIEWTKDQELVRLRGRLLPLVRLAQLLHAESRCSTPWVGPEPSDGAALMVAIVRAGSRRFGLAIDQVLANEEIVVKPMHTHLRGLRIYSGATVRGDGSVALILSAEGIANVAQIRFGSDALVRAESERMQAIESQEVLVVQEFGGRRSAVPVSAIRRVVMVDRSQFTRLDDHWYTTIDGVPTRVCPLGQSTPEWEPQGMAFALLPRGVTQAIGWIVEAVSGIEPVGRNEVHALPNEPQKRVAILGGCLTNLVDLPALARGTGNAFTAPRRVLLVDDTQFFRDVVSKYLRDTGYAVTTAEHGAAALELLQSNAFDLVISDLEMPVLDGLGLAAAVRGDATLRHLPLLALTTLSSQEVRAQALRQGFDDLEVKLQQASLLAAVDRLLQKAAAATPQTSEAHSHV